MKRLAFGILFGFLCLLSIPLSAKRIYYVRAGATGDGSSWGNAGNIREMMDKATAGDEIWMAEGTYYGARESIESWTYDGFPLKTGVSLYGGFLGDEKSIDDRRKVDRDFNGSIEPWEYRYETILSGEAGITDHWIVDENNRTMQVTGLEDNTNYVLHFYYSDYDNKTSIYTQPFYLSGLTITGAKVLGLDVRDWNIDDLNKTIVIQDCEFYHNENGIGYSSDMLRVENSCVHHNRSTGINYSSSVRNSYIHHNGGGIYGANIVDQCTICYNGYNDDYARGGGDGYKSVFTNCDIFENYSKYSGGGLCQSTAYYCNIYNNKTAEDGGGVYNSKIYYSLIEENESLRDGGGVSCCNLYNCIIRNNISGGNGGGTNLSVLKDCTISSNKSGKDGGGVYRSKLSNCVVSHNFAVSNGGGIHNDNSEYIIDCEIYNNEALNDGGGLCNARDVYGVKVYNNRAGKNGGGLYYSDVYYASIFNNQSEGEGGGIKNGSAWNCDIYNNYANDGGGSINSSCYSCTIAHNQSASNADNSGEFINSLVVGTIDVSNGYSGRNYYSIFTDSYVYGEGNFMASEKELKFVKPSSFVGIATSDSQLEELKLADFSLSEGSSAIDMGVRKFGEQLPMEDIKGNPRPMGAKIDIGAHEFLSPQPLPYENNFDETSLSMNGFGNWKNDKLPGKSIYSLYYEGNSSFLAKRNVATTPFFAKTVSNRINLSVDIAGKFKATDKQEKLHIILAYLDSEERDTIQSYTNTAYTCEENLNKEISSWVGNRIFRILFAVEDSKIDVDGYRNESNIVYWGISNLKLTKQDASVQIFAKDQVVEYDGKPHSISYTIADERISPSKVSVRYLKEGEGVSTSTPPTNAGTYRVRISYDDGMLFGLTEVKLTIQKANQTIQWPQVLRSMKGGDRIRLEATTSSGLPVSFSMEEGSVAKIEKVNDEFWLVADTLSGYVTIKASQAGNSNYNLANSVLKTIQIEYVPTAISAINLTKPHGYYDRFSRSLCLESVPIGTHIYVYDATGRMLLARRMENDRECIALPNLSGRICYVQLVRGQYSHTIKVRIY